MNHNKFVGIFCAAIAAVTYGMNPFFGLPLYQEGLSPFSVLFYRFFLAAILMGIVTALRKSSFFLPRECRIPAAAAGVIMALTCAFWFLTFRIMDSGISAALLFVYPVMVALIMAIFFKEKPGKAIIAGIILAVAGAVIICYPGSGAKINTPGLIYIMLSALTYAVYIVMVRKSSLHKLAPETLTFYAMLFSLPVFLLFLRGGADLQMLPSLKALGNALGLALFPSVLSFLMAAVAIRNICATPTAIFGALEPVNAVFIGVCIFHEAITVKIVAGVTLILAVVVIVICSTSSPKQKSS